MTPREKAVELLNEFRPMVNPYIGSGMLSDTPDEDAILWQAKRCALVTVEEILSMGIMSESGEWRMAKPYWQEVKEEIQNFNTKEK